MASEANTTKMTTHAGLSMDGTVLCVGLPEAGYGGRSVRVFLADQTGAFVERLNVTAPNNGPAGSRFGAQVCCFVLLPCPCTPHLLLTRPSNLNH